MEVKHGGNLNELIHHYQLESGDLIDFSANINPLGLPELFQTILSNLKTKIEHYPDYNYQELKNTYLKWQNLSLSTNQVLVGNGAAEILRAIAYTLAPRTIIIEPTFSEYELNGQFFDHEIYQYSLSSKDHFDLNITDFVHWLDQLPQAKSLDDFGRQGVIYLCNPTNPTGQLYDRSTVQQLIQALDERDYWLVIDESFIDFVPQAEEYTWRYDIDRYSHLLIIHSVTKYYALPGLRLGYALCADQTLVQHLEAFIVTWSVNVVAQECGLHLGQLDDYRAQTQSQYQSWQEDLYAQLQTIPDLTVYPSVANFFLIQSPVTNFYEQLLNQGIVIRDCRGYLNLSDGFYRVAVRTPKENQRLIEALRQVKVDG